MNKWWQNETIYQVYPRSFNDSNNDGIGDINGITQKLDYLKYLGITMIWLCPVYKSPNNDNGYDISDYEAINPEFGTMADLDNLIKEAKKRGIKLIMDLVVNHTSDEHPWFKKALADPNSKYRKYYIFKPGVDGHAPNNWRSVFGGSVWEKVPGEDQYWMHVFSTKQPDLNWENSEMRQDIYDMINWWLDKGIAGFRIDAITYLKKDQDFASIPADEKDGTVNVDKKSQNRPGLGVILSDLKKHTFAKHDCMTVGEAPGVPYSQFSDFIGPNGYFSMIFDFHYTSIDVKNDNEWWVRPNWTTSEYKNLLFASQHATQKYGWSANFLENHDQPRSLSKLVKDPAYRNEIGAKALGTLLICLRGTPFVYQGEELGMTNFHRHNINEFNDISSINNYHVALKLGYKQNQAMHIVNSRSRDNTRTPYPWNGSKFGDFSAAKPWLGMSGDEDKVNNATERQDPKSTMNFYRNLIKLRNNSPYSETMIHGNIKQTYAVPENVIGFTRNNPSHVAVLINLSSQKQIIHDTHFNRLLSNNYDVLKQDQADITLNPYQAIIYEMN